jgi:uncharacterized protein (TIGR02453 family)
MKIKTILDFLNMLKNNNNREWFQQNKSIYENAHKEFLGLTSELIHAISTFDNDVLNLDAASCVFRIYRDVRFSKNKEPYKTNFGAFINKHGKKSGNAGYYMHLDPSGSFLAGGIYMPEPDKLKLLRNEIFYNYETFLKIINDKDFKKYFGAIEGEKLLKVPKEFPKDFAGADYLKLKSYTMIHAFKPETIKSEKEFMVYATEIFSKMYDFNAFLDNALS